MKTIVNLPYKNREESWIFSLLLLMNKPKLAYTNPLFSFPNFKLFVMKQFLLVIMVLFIGLACSSKKDDKKETKEATVKAMATPVDEKAQKTEELKKAQQLTLEQMRALLPSELDSAKERNYRSSTQFGYPFATIEYPKTKSRVIKITLYDCAGELGFNNYFENYWDYLNVNKQTDQEFTRTIDFEGGKAVETYKKDMNLSTLTFVVKDHLVIIMEGKNMSSEQLEAAAKKLYQKIA